MHIVIRSIYSIYTDFSIYGFGMELGYLHNNNKNKNQTIMSLQVTHTWLMTEILQIVASEVSNPCKKYILNYSADKCDLNQRLIACHFTSNCHSNEFWNVINSIDLEVIFSGVRAT